MSASKQKGTRWETAIVGYLRGLGFMWADRLPLSGARDRGDITIGPGSPTIEAKNQARHSLAEWLDEAEQEAANARAPFAAVWIKRRGFTDPGKGYVVTSGATFARLMREAGYTQENVA